MKSFKKRFLAVLTAVTMLTSCVVTSGVSVSAATSELPTNVIIGYWHNFDNGSTTTKLADINKNWDVVIASFLTTGSDLCTAEFEVDPSIYPSNSKAEFIADVKELQARGVKVMVSLGGQNGHIELENDAARDKFLSTCIAVVKEYGFDGLDVDLEGSSITATAGLDTVETCGSPIQKNLNYILHELVKEFGSDFMITMAPEHPYVQGGTVAIGGPWGAYLPLLNNCRDILTFIHPQYYNNPIDYWLPDGTRVVGYNADSLVTLSELLIYGFSTPTGDFEGLRPDQVAFGVPCSSSAANSGQISISESQKALKTLITNHPSFRGIMTWSINWDEAQNNDGFVEGMRTAIEEAQANLPELELASIDANVAGTVKLGTEVSWTANATGGTSPYQYKFQVYKDNALAATHDFSSNAGITTTLIAAGSYKVTVTVKDTAGAIVSKTSNVIVADENAPDEPEVPSGGAVGELPTNVVIGYWHDFDNGSTTTQLGDVNENWDVVIASFLTTGRDYCTAEFVVDPAIYPTNPKIEFIKDVKELQARGVRVMVSLGGQNGHIDLSTDEKRDKFLETCIDVINEYGFDGLDVDLEGSSITITPGLDTVETCGSPIQKNLNYVLHELVNEFGSDFMITMAPEHPYVQGGLVAMGTPWGAYLPLLNNCRDILTFIHPQYYNNGIGYSLPDGTKISGFSADSLVALSEMLIDGFTTNNGTGETFEGLRPDQVAFGVPASKSAANTGQLSIAAYQTALKTLIQKYPTFRGIMTWSTNWDEKENNSGFVNGMSATIDQYGDGTVGGGDGGSGDGGTTTTPTEPLVISSFSPSVTGTVQTGIDVSWVVNVTGGKAPYEYQIELMKDNKVVAIQDYSSNSGTSTTLTEAGKYKIRATVKDAEGTTVSRISGVITAEAPVVADRLEFAMKLDSDSAFVNGTVEKTSGSNNDGEGMYYAQLRFEGSSLVLPLRYVAESAGLEVGYDIFTGLTTITDGSTTVKIIQDSSNIIVVKGGVESTVDIGTPAKPFRQVLHIPVRGVLTQFDNLTIKYDYMTGYVTVTDYDPTDAEFSDLLSRVQAVL